MGARELIERLGPVESEREDRLKSLLTDRIALEAERLREELHRRGLSASVTSRVNHAFEFARAQNYGPRPRDRHYPAHAARVARFVTAWLPTECDANVIIAALVHNGFEKGIVTEERLEAEFGAWVATAIRALTVDRVAMASDTGRRSYYAALAAKPVEFQALKILDKFDNLLSLCANPDAGVRERYAEEAETFVAPMAERVMREFAPYLRSVIETGRGLGHYCPAF